MVGCCAKLEAKGSFSISRFIFPLAVLKLKPFNEIGTPMEIINGVFGGKANYENALKELEKELFKQERIA